MLCLIYMHDARGRAAPKGECICIYIRQSTSACVITNIFHFRHSKNLPNSIEIFWPLYIVVGARCDCGTLFYRCHDVLAR